MSLETTLLISVNSVITDEGMIYPLNKSNEPVMNKGIHVADCTDEWVSLLSENDYNRVLNRGFDTCMHNKSWNTDCDECNIDEYSPGELAELDFINTIEDGELMNVDGYLI